MAQRKEDHFLPGARPRPAGDSNEDKDTGSLQSVSHGSLAARSASGEVGIIESIQLENFMCHAKLGPIHFGPNVNFVVGFKGKSALLTALIVALGGKSFGSSLTKFVKDGKSSANISIILKNTGENAFRYDVYGDSITVQQFISVNGTVNYRLKGQSGNLVSSKKVELTAILDHFNIHIDNAVSVVQQDMGRELLQIKNDADRYKFFLKVTHLEQMNTDYLSILEKKAKTQNQVQQGEKQLQELKHQGIDIEECFQTMVSTRKRIEDLKNEKAWAVVIESEKQIEDMISNIRIGDQNTVKLNQELEACQAKINEAINKFKNIQKNLQQLNKEATALEAKCIEAEEDLSKKERACEKAEVLYNSSQNEFKGLNKAKQHCNQAEDLRKNMEQEKMCKEEKIFMLREKLKNLKEQEDLLLQGMGHLQQAIQKDNEEHSRLTEELSDIQQILNGEQQQLNRLKDCRTDPSKRFEPQIISLLEAVDNAQRRGRFTSKPIGPLGAYIHLRDPDFALAIESCLKGLLLAFCCDNHKDEQVLQGLMKKFYPPSSPRPQIIVSTFQCEVYDVTDRAAFHPEFPTVLTALEIDNAVVANALIDMRGIESVLLIKSNSLARTVMQAQKPPKNCNEAFTADGDQVFERRYYSCEKLRPTYLIDVEREISHLEKEIENTMAQLSVYQQQACTLENDITKNQETINNHHLHLKEIKIRMAKVIMQIRDVENGENQPVDISDMEIEENEIEKKMKLVEEKMKIQKEEMENFKKQKIDAEQKHENIKMRICQVSELTESAKQELNQVSLEMEAEKQCVLHCQDRIKQNLDSLQMKKEELDRKKKGLEKEIAQAKYICPERKEVDKPSCVIDREFSFLKQKIKTESKTFKSKEDIIRRYQEVKECYQSLDVKVKNLKKSVISLDQTSIQRYEIYQQFRRSLALRCKLYFDNLLSQWAYKGQMSFDHRNETLSIKVQPKQENKAAFGDMKSLSGSGSCLPNFLFIISLWSISESPFRCLDSFDSYMDPISRRIALDLILKIAHSQKYRQFILLTAQNMNFLPQSPLTKMILLPDDEKFQNALPFEPVSEEEED